MKCHNRDFKHDHVKTIANFNSMDNLTSWCLATHTRIHIFSREDGHYCSGRHWAPGPRVNIKKVFPSMGIPMLKKRRPWGRLIFNMGSLYWQDDIAILRRIPGHYVHQLCNTFGGYLFKIYIFKKYIWYLVCTISIILPKDLSIGAEKNVCFFLFLLSWSLVIEFWTANYVTK